jgi:D-3-phosphoglycerate dehydrogenase / 2-oxoglutarate reductase
MAERQVQGGGAPRRWIALISETAQLGLEHLRPLEDAGFELVDRYELSGVVAEDELIAGLRGVWATVAGSEPYTRRLLEQCSELRAIARCGVGYDAIDVPAATREGVAVLTTPGANAEAVADLTLTLALACVRHLLDLDDVVRSGGWRPNALFADLAGASVGIVGLGTIGQAVARRLSGFGCRILAVEAAPDLAVCSTLGIELTTLERLLPEVDVLTLHVPLTAETHHLVSTGELALLRPGAIVVNTARGGVLDTAALVEALTSGRLGGAGLDVFEDEPLPAGHPLLELPNVVLTGHAATFTRGGVGQTLDAVVRNLLALDAGTAPAGLVNPGAAPALERTSSSYGRGGAPRGSG